MPVAPGVPLAAAGVRRSVLAEQCSVLSASPCIIHTDDKALLGNNRGGEGASPEANDCLTKRLDLDAGLG